MEIKRFEITEELAGTRLDKAAAQLLDTGRNRAAELVKNGKVTVNGQPEKAKYPLQLQDIVEIEVPDPEESKVLPEKMELDIVYEDEDLLVINKPRGLVVHPAPGHTTGTLVNGLLAHCTDLSGINGVMRPGIVHRIDKDTSGLLIVCKNDLAHESISGQLSRKECAREYKAIVHHPFSHIHGTINAPIGRDEKDRQKMTVTNKNAKDAVTHFEVLENFKDAAYLLCRLETGRTHQIRVHMQYIGHPIFGDPFYGYRKDAAMDTRGQLLHAYAIEFTHPRTHERMRFEVEPDETFQKVLKQLEEENQ